ncbi:MAG TPA: 1-acyl-sn-glycerol-3-phosphate acyltransferase [Acidimicrobiia bacterium]|nr:1-acyl-sn-glycerol-3-phosphate acyltransferase [Acidimicrobiia bacterium]
MYRLRWWIAGVIARFYTLGIFTKVEIIGEVDTSRPTLFVANHFGGFVDAIVVVRALGGLPHIVAKSTLFERLPLRLILKMLGVVPVYRRADTADQSKNRGSFDEVAAVLAKGRSVLIFPEGTVTDTQELQTIRTGAARMALTAIAQGTDDLRVAPVGITYEDKVSSRSRVLVEIGEPLTAADIIDISAGSPIDPENRDLVATITEEIRSRLAAVAPDYGSYIRERTMMLAASIHLRTVMTTAFVEPSMAALRKAAQHLGNATRNDDRALPATADYQLALAGCGLEDHQIQPRATVGRLARLSVRKAIIIIVISPLALFGLVANIIPILLILAVGAVIKEPVSKGTARVLAGIVLFPISWALLISFNDFEYVWFTVVLLFLGVILLVIAVGQVFDLFEAATGWWAVRNHLGLLPELRELRSEAEGELASLVGEPN